MRLTLHTDYAMRMLISLALHRGTLTVQEIALQYGLSRNHLLKIALRLKAAGFVQAVRGRSGGVSLARDPSHINIGQVIRAMEDDFHLVECLRREGGQCVLTPACQLKDLAREALDAFLSVFDRYSLADLTRNGPDLGRQLKMTAMPGLETATSSPVACIGQEGTP